jgi:hypothetical protein
MDVSSELKMVEKQWFWCHASWTPGFWLKNDVWELKFWHKQKHLNQPLASARLRTNISPSKPSKMILWMYQVNWKWLRSNGFGAMLVGLLDSGSRMTFESWNFNISRNTLTSPLQVQDSKESIYPLQNHPKWFHGCIKWIKYGWEAMVLVPCWLDSWILAQEWRLRAEIST